MNSHLKGRIGEFHSSNTPKGQLSFDMMIAIIVLLVTMQLFITLTGDIKESQEVMGIRAQQKSIALGIERVLQSGMIFSTGASEVIPFEIKYVVPKIMAQNGSELGCSITIETKPTTGVKNLVNYTEIIVRSSATTTTLPNVTAGKIIETRVPINVPNGFLNYGTTGFECGKLATIREQK